MLCSANVEKVADTLTELLEEGRAVEWGLRADAARRSSGTDSA